MNFAIKVTSGETVKEYTIPDNVNVQCGSGDEIGESTTSYGVSCSVDITDGEMFPTVLHDIADDCLLFTGYTVQCLYDGVVIFEQQHMSSIKYRIVKIRDATSIREEVLFYA